MFDKYRTYVKKAIIFFGGLLALASASVPASGQVEGTIRGIVSSADDGSSLPDANVVLATEEDSLFRAGVTDVDGYYEIEHVPSGRYYLRVSYIGFDTYRDTVHIGTQRVQKNVSLTPRSSQLDEVTVESRENPSAQKAGLQTIEPASVGRIPTPGPGGDLAAYLNTLTSVTSTGDRGGNCMCEVERRAKTLFSSTG